MYYLYTDPMSSVIYVLLHCPILPVMKPTKPTSDPPAPGLTALQQ